MIGAKTAALFDAAMHVGALVADAPAQQVQALATYGYELGIAFQMTDDALDFSASAQDMGKAAGDDFREGKITLPIILAHQAGTAEEQAFWQRTVGKVQQTEGDLDTALRYLEAHGALAETLNRAEQAGQRAVAALDICADSPIKSLLHDLIQFVVNRRH